MASMSIGGLRQVRNAVWAGAFVLALIAAPVSAQLFVADGDAVLSVNLTNGNRSEVSGPMQGTGDAFVSLTGIAVQDADTLYVLDEVAAGVTMRLVEVDISTGDRTTFGETGDGNGPDWTSADSLAFDERGNLYTTSPDAGIIRWALSGGQLSQNRLRQGNIVADGFDIAPVDDERRGYITDLVDEAVLFSFLPGGFPTIIVSHEFLGTGEVFNAPAGIWRVSSSAALVANSGATGSLMEVSLTNGNRTTLSGGTGAVGTGPAFVSAIDAVRNEGGTTFVLDQGLPAVISVNVATGQRSVVSGFDGSTTIGTGPGFSSPTAFAPAVTTPATGGPANFDSSNIRGMGFMITGGVGNDVDDDFAVGSPFISPDFPSEPAVIEFEAGGVTAILDNSPGADTETTAANGSGIIYGGAYAGSTGNLRLDATRGFVFDDTHPGSYVYTRFGLSGSPDESTLSANVPTVNANSFLVFTFKRETGSTPHAGDLVGAFLFRDGDRWYQYSDVFLPGTMSSTTLTVTLEWPSLVEVLEPVDPQLAAELDAVDNGNEPSFVGTQSGMGIAVWREVGETLHLTIPAPIDEGQAISWMRNGSPLSNGGRISGADARTLQIVNLMFSDTGSYTATYDDGTKALSVFGPANVQVFAAGSLPVAGAVGMGLLAAGIAAAGMWRRRRRS